MSFLCTDTKGDLFRNYGTIARDFYGYSVAVIDLRNPTRSDGNKMLHLVNKYMDIYRANPDDLASKARAEKYAKIIAKTIINSSGDSSSYGQNAFFYDAAEGLLCAVILLVAEYLPPKKQIDGTVQDCRHTLGRPSVPPLWDAPAVSRRAGCRVPCKMLDFPGSDKSYRPELLPASSQSEPCIFSCWQSE